MTMMMTRAGRLEARQPGFGPATRRPEIGDLEWTTERRQTEIEVKEDDDDESEDDDDDEEGRPPGGPAARLRPGCPAAEWLGIGDLEWATERQQTEIEDEDDDDDEAEDDDDDGEARPPGGPAARLRPGCPAARQAQLAASRCALPWQVVESE